jgi:hypothetical protein
MGRSGAGQDEAQLKPIRCPGAEQDGEADDRARDPREPRPDLDSLGTRRWAEGLGYDANQALTLGRGGASRGHPSEATRDPRGAIGAGSSGVSGRAEVLEAEAIHFMVGRSPACAHRRACDSWPRLHGSTRTASVHASSREFKDSLPLVEQRTRCARSNPSQGGTKRAPWTSTMECVPRSQGKSEVGSAGLP